MLPGKPAPLGATVCEGGVNFALWSGSATRVDLCVFDGETEIRHELPRCTNGVWHGLLTGAGPGLRYGYRVHGPYEPETGQRFNPAKLLIDPYARALTGVVRPDDRHLDYRVEKGAWQPDPRDSAAVIPKAVVIAPTLNGGKRPAIPLEDSVIYELHVKGFTARHPGISPELRGTYLGLAQPPVIDYLKGLGVTAVELLPCASFMTEPLLAGRGLTNYWGYNTVAFSAPHSGYAATDPVTEFRAMVGALHEAGIEVLLDVVYNHTAEGGAGGPSLSFRGIDNAGYYLLRTHDRAACVNNSGCGNSLAVSRPPVMQLVMDSLRYWVEEMGVDGFRFDLAPSMARVDGEYRSDAPFLQAIHQDPVLSGVKLIAEPWDAGHAGYRLGQFPAGWSEWNDKYRATVRSFWRGDRTGVADLSSRLSGSSDIFGSRGPVASVNYVTAHDGFTLADLVSYEERHNEANGEDNRDGNPHNQSWNHGVEGPTDTPQIKHRRLRDRRALLATLLLSQGVPMLLGGDELGRTQRGNNNAYCQDNELSWIDWENADTDLSAFVAALIGWRSRLGVLRRREYLQGQLHEHGPVHDVQWLRPDGAPMQVEQWHDPDHRAIAVLLRGDLAEPRVAPRHRLPSDDALVVINGYNVETSFSLPVFAGAWTVAVDSGQGELVEPGLFRSSPGSVTLLVRPRS